MLWSVLKLSGQLFLPPYGNLWRHFWSLQLEEHPTNAVKHPAAHRTAPYCKGLCNPKWQQCCCWETPGSNLTFSLFIHTVGILTVPSWIVTKSRWNNGWCWTVFHSLCHSQSRPLWNRHLSRVRFPWAERWLSIVPIWFHDVCPWQVFCMVCLSAPCHSWLDQGRGQMQTKAVRVLSPRNSVICTERCRSSVWLVSWISSV